jgi:D-amino-acid dehydrogenase
MSRRTAIVVGGGVIGVASAYYLACDGWDVTLVERGEVCAGSSYGNAGLVVPSHVLPLAAPGVWWQGLKWMLDPESPFYVKPRLDPALLSWLWRFRAACHPARARPAMSVLRALSLASLDLYRELAKIDGLDFAFRESGSMLVFRTPEAFEHGIAEARLLGEAGVVMKVLDGPAARAIEPALRPEVVGAVASPEDAVLVPDRFVRGLARVAESQGARVRASTEVLGFRVAGDRVVAVETTRGRLEADTVVLATGAWSPEVARSLGLRIPIQPAKGYSLTYRRPPDSPNTPLLPAESRFSITPMGDLLRFGGTLELAGMDLTVNRRRVDVLPRSAARYIRLDPERLELLEIWRGLRPCTPDGLPLLGRSGRWANLILATGHAMIGMSLGPVTGKLVAQIAGDQPTPIDLRLLDPERFRWRGSATAESGP